MIPRDRHSSWFLCLVCAWGVDSSLATADLLPVSFSRRLVANNLTSNLSRTGPQLGQWSDSLVNDRLTGLGNHYTVRASQTSDMTATAITFAGHVENVYLPPTFQQQNFAQAFSEGTAIFDIAAPQTFGFEFGTVGGVSDQFAVLQNQTNQTVFLVQDSSQSPVVGTLAPGRYTLTLAFRKEQIGSIPFSGSVDYNVILRIPAPGHALVFGSLCWCLATRRRAVS